MKTSKSNSTLFISDLHLDIERPELTQAFLKFLVDTAQHAETLYILGDFFNIWIGDDLCTEPGQTVAASLKHLAEHGTQIFIMHGNRDFLLGKTFIELCGGQLIQEPHLLTLYDESYLLVHGDSLCTRDTDYMAFRNMVRDPQWQQQFLAQPITTREEFARQARNHSIAANSNKSDDIMDVTPAEVVNILEKFDVSTLIHGHTHRPAIHDVSLKHAQARRIVLGDWDKQGWYLEICPTGLELKTLPIPA